MPTLPSGLAEQADETGGKQYAWERGAVKSSIPAAEQPRKCKGCSADTTAGKLRYGYCSACWESFSPGDA
uniref:hypothetical protein n=1 Tax=Streptosporangium sp. CA-235898 TaxID=3240073 RepID=UPI003F4998B3